MLFNHNNCVLNCKIQFIESVLFWGGGVSQFYLNQPACVLIKAARSLGLRFLILANSSWQGPVKSFYLVSTCPVNIILGERDRNISAVIMMG